MDRSRSTARPCSTATTQYVMRIESAFHPGVDEPYKMLTDKGTEQWAVTFAKAALGGWKVCRIDIADPIQASFERS